MTDGGISFGALSYYHPDVAIREQFAALPDASVVYNYLGQMDSLDNEYFGLAAETAGSPVAPSMRRASLLDSNALVTDGQLHIHWTVTPQLTRDTAQALLDKFSEHLDGLIAEALQASAALPDPVRFCRCRSDM